MLESKSMKTASLARRVGTGDRDSAATVSQSWTKSSSVMRCGLSLDAHQTRVAKCLGGCATSVHSL